MIDILFYGGPWDGQVRTWHDDTAKEIRVAGCGPGTNFLKAEFPEVEYNTYHIHRFRVPHPNPEVVADKTAHIAILEGAARPDVHPEIMAFAKSQKWTYRYCSILNDFDRWWATTLFRHGLERFTRFSKDRI